MKEIRDLNILAIESSCDETAAAVVHNGREVLSNIISSQIDLHKLYGGVVPEIASRKHIEKINQVIEEALKEADVTLDDIDVVGVTYGRITIRHQTSRWGSCSAKGNLSFNCLLMLTPPEVIDSVVVHELCHRKEMNHSTAFYAHVLRVFPEYRTWRRWLKDNGPALLLRRKGQVSGQVERAAYCAEYMFCLIKLFTTIKNARVRCLY